MKSVWLLALVLPLSAAADDTAKLVNDRAAVEHVYYEHRLGTKPPFEKALPHQALEALVKRDLKKEAVLKRVYKTEITPAQVEAEVKRIDSNTRAPGTLAEIKKALGNDPKRFAHAVARPIVVERELRSRFENDDKLHAGQRTEVEAVRKNILAASDRKNVVDLLNQAKAGEVTETTWQLTPRLANQATGAPPAPAANLKATGGPYSVEANAHPAQTLSPPETAKEQKFYFEDLSPELRNTLTAQLRKPGDVSAVIETPSAFLLFVANEKTDATLSAASLTIPKLSYDEWLAHQQPD